MKFAFVIAALFAASAIAAPCNRKHVDDVATGDDISAFDDSTAPAPAVSDADADDERKTSTPDVGNNEDSQTAVINNNSPDHGSKGSLIGVSADNVLAGGLLSNTKNTIHQGGDH